MDVKLAGFNVDIDGIKKIKELLQSNSLSNDDRITALKMLEELTPETISASYARISRDPAPIYKLREKARGDVENARKSNKAIIFTMGHKSIAEHAFFNFDIMDISRHLVENIEEKRLQSYTEKSQRYITLKGDFVIPQEIKGTPFEDKFVEIIELQNSFYKNNIDILVNWHKNRDYNELFNSLNYLDNKNKQISVLEDLGKEDARYALAMATQTQLGMSTSARNLEVLITKLNSSDIFEEQELGKALLEEVNGIAPSVIKYTKPVDYFMKTREKLKLHISCLVIKNDLQKYNCPFTSELLRKDLRPNSNSAKKSGFPWLSYLSYMQEVSPLKFFDDLKEYNDHRDTSADQQNLEVSDNYDVGLFTGLKRDDSIIAGLIFSSSFLSYLSSLELLSKLDYNEKIRILDIADKYQEKFDPKLREYELGDRVAQLSMSSSAFAQIKRHRINTLITQPYNPSLGITTPPSIMGGGLGKTFFEIQDKTNGLYTEMVKSGVKINVAEYILTNAHKRRVLLDANNRQINAIAAERLNLAAQWDIRNLIGSYIDLLKENSPLTLRYACGKHEFDEVKKKRYMENE